MSKNVLRWEPTAPVKPANTLKILSVDVPPFIPSYSLEKRPNVYYLLCMEYSRIWFAEKHDYDALVYPPKNSQEGKYLRKRVDRNINARIRKGVENKLPQINIKKFLNVPAKSINRRSPL